MTPFVLVVVKLELSEICTTEHLILLETHRFVSGNEFNK